MASRHCGGYRARNEGEEKVSAVRWRHVKTGGTYVEIGRGKMQTDDWLMSADQATQDVQRNVVTYGSADMRPVVIYISDKDGSIWVRPEEEFMDGRFVAVTT